jgi:hypothetical protein
MGVIDKIEFNDYQVTAWGGMKLMKDMLDASKIKKVLIKLPLTEKGSNLGYDPITRIFLDKYLDRCRSH